MTKKRNMNVTNCYSYAGPVESGRGGSRKTPDSFSSASPPANARLCFFATLKRHLLLPLALATLIGCGDGTPGIDTKPKNPNPEMTNSLPMGGCSTGVCGTLTREHLRNVSNEAYQLGVATADVDESYWAPHGISRDYCRLVHGCDFDTGEKHESLLRNKYFDVLHNAFLEREHQYHSQFNNTFGRDDFQAENRVYEDGELAWTVSAWPCFNDADRALAREAYIEKFKKLHPRTTSERFVPQPCGGDIIENFEVGFD